MGSLGMLGVDRWSWPQGEGCMPPPTLSSEVSAHHGIQVTSGQWKRTLDTPRALGLRSVGTVGWEVGTGRGESVVWCLHVDRQMWCQDPTSTRVSHPCRENSQKAQCN